MHEQLRHNLLGRWAGLIARRPIATLTIALVVAGLCVWLAATRMGFEPNRNALIAEHLEWNQRFAQWQQGFAGSLDLLVIVDALPNAKASGRGYTDDQLAAQHAQAQAAINELAAALQEQSHVEQVAFGFDPLTVSPKAMRLLPLDEFKTQLETFAQGMPVLTSTTPAELLTSQPVSPQAFTPEAIQSGADMINAWRAILADPDPVLEQDASPLESLMRQQAGYQYLTSDNGRLYFIKVTPRPEEGSLNALEKAIAQTRAVLADTRPKFAGVEMGLTGIEVVEGDETQAATRDSTIASGLAAVLIAVLLVLAFQSWRTPLMLMIALLVGIAWTFGFLTLSIGYLQVISVVFTVILLGIAIGFGIHLAAHIELVRHEHDDTADGFAAALGQSLQTVGPGVLTGAVTTSAAFCTTLFTDFTGVAEMGLIAAVGIMLCLLAMVSVFPALLRLGKPAHAHVAAMDSRWVHFFEERWVMPFVRRPRTTLLVVALLTASAGVGVTQMRFDYNLLKLLPRGIDSIAWQQRLVEDGGQSIWFGVSMVDSVWEARELTEKFRGLDTVASVGGVGLLFPEDQAEKQQLIEDMHERLMPGVRTAQLEIHGAQELAIDPYATLPAVRQVQSGLSMAAMLPGMSRRVAPLREALRAFVEQAESMDEAALRRGLRAVQTAHTRFRGRVAEATREAIDPARMTLADLPPLVAEMYTGQVDGQSVYALEVYPQLPDGVDDPLDPQFLSRFVRDLESVDPDITGVIVQVYKSGDLIQRSYQLAGLLAVLIVFVLVWIDFRSLADALLALVPVAVGFTLTFGLLHALGMSINPANIIVLPLMFGIGVDAGVHVIHRYRMNPAEQPPGLVRGTGKGITVTSLTTIIAFACMTTASHRGIASLGFVLASGITLTLLACWTLMPAWLSLRRPGLGLRA